MREQPPLPSVPSGYMGKSQYFKRAETLIKYFKQRKTNIAAQSLPLSLSLCVPLSRFVLSSRLAPKEKANR